MPDDHAASIRTDGSVAGGGSATGDIETGNDRDWFAVELVAGRTYVFDLEGSPTGAGTLHDTYLRGIHDANGNWLSGTTNDDGGTGTNSRLTFTATESGTHYVATEGYGSGTGTYELSVRDTDPDTIPEPDTTPVPQTPQQTQAPTDADAARAGATELGDITGLAGPAFPTGAIDGGADAVDYYRFTLTEAKQIGLGLRQQDTNADLFLEDAEGNVLHGSTEAGTASEGIGETLLAGTYYVRIETQEAGQNDYVFRYGVTAADPEAVRELERLLREENAGQVPAFGQQDHVLALAENADGRTSRVSLGTVSATDPEGSTLAYSVVGGNEAGLFEIDAATGELFYAGSGEDYESGSTQFDLTVRASDGTQSTDTAVTVNVADVDETPTFNQQDYAFDLVENADGSTSRVSLGTVSATDPEGAALAYSVVGGNEAGLFGIDAASGELFYVGAGEDFESGSTQFELTVQASDGTVSSDSTVTVNVTDVLEVPAFGEQGYAFELAENTDGSTQRVSLGIVAAVDPDGTAVEYSLEAGNGSGLLQVEAATGELFYTGSGEDYESGTTPFALTVRASDGTLFTDMTVTVNVTDMPEQAIVEAPVAQTPQAGATDLGDITGLAGPAFPTGRLDGGADAVDYFRFTLTEAKRIGLGLRQQDTNADLLLEDAEGNVLHSSTEAGTASEWIGETLLAGTYYVRIETQEAGRNDYVFRYGVTAADPDEVARLQAQMETSEEYSADTGTAGRVAPGGSIASEVEQDGDQDWFAVDLIAGAHYRIDLKGSLTGDGTLLDPRLHGIYDSNGQLLSGTTNDDGGSGWNSRVYFEAPTDGTYYVAAGGVGSDTGTYTLSVAAIEDDFVAATSTSGVVTVGGSVTGEIDGARDRDWFAVDLTAGTHYRIDLEGNPTGRGTLWDPYLRGIYDSNGQLLSGTTNGDGGTGRNSRVYFEAPTDGTYHVAAGSFSFLMGTYTLSVVATEDDFTAAPSMSGVVTVGGSAPGQIEAYGDRDWFAVDLTAGTRYRIDLKGSWTGDGTLWDPYLRGIYDSNGQLLSGTTDHDGGNGQNARVDFEAPTDGTYYVAAGTHGSRTGTYTLSVAATEDDFAATTSTSGMVTVGGSATGEVETPVDRDWFAVDLTTGTHYRIDLEGRPTGDGTLRDPYLRGIYDSNGQLLSGTTDHDGGTGQNARVDFEAPTDGTYYVAAGAYGSRRGTYTLSVAAIEDDFAAVTSTSGMVTVGGSATGEVETPGDQDWFAVDLTAGARYRIDLERRFTENGTLWDPHLRGIYDPNGQLLSGTTNDDGGFSQNSRVYFGATTDGTYYIAAGTNGSGTGTYTLSVAAIEDDFAAAPSTSGVVTAGGSATGEIEEPYDQDWFAVELSAGTRYRIDLEGRSTGDGTLWSPYLSGIYDSNGQLLSETTNDDGGTGHNARVYFDATTDGTYYVAAGAYNSHTGTYTLSVAEDTI